MNALNVFYRGNVGFELHESIDVENTLLEYLVLCIEEAFLTLGMSGTDRPIESGEKH
jgi:hypothetical protein